jgi:hypothetical protein
MSKRDLCLPSSWTPTRRSLRSPIKRQRTSYHVHAIETLDILFRSAVKETAVVPRDRPTVLLAYKRLENQVSDGKMASFKKVYDTLSDNERKSGFLYSHLEPAICI